MEAYHLIHHLCVCAIFHYLSSFAWRGDLDQACPPKRRGSWKSPVNGPSLFISIGFIHIKTCCTLQVIIIFIIDSSADYCLHHSIDWLIYKNSGQCLFCPINHPNLKIKIIMRSWGHSMFLYEKWLKWLLSKQFVNILSNDFSWTCIFICFVCTNLYL